MKANKPRKLSQYEYQAVINNLLFVSRDTLNKGGILASDDILYRVKQLCEYLQLDYIGVEKIIDKHFQGMYHAEIPGGACVLP